MYKPREIQELATAVRKARQSYGMTQATLAGLSGTGLRFIGELERGKPTLTLDKVLKVMAVLGLSISIEGRT